MGAKPAQLNSASHSLEHELKAQSIVIVNGTPYGLEALDTLLEPGQYDVITTDSTSDAYSVIKRVKPVLVLIGLPLDDLDTFQVLSMLKLDDETRSIRIVLFGDDGEFLSGIRMEGAPSLTPGHARYS